MAEFVIHKRRPRLLELTILDEHPSKRVQREIPWRCCCGGSLAVVARSSQQEVLVLLAAYQAKKREHSGGPRGKHSSNCFFFSFLRVFRKIFVCVPPSSQFFSQFLVYVNVLIPFPFSFNRGKYIPPVDT